jgi:hypothetical protein
LPCESATSGVADTIAASQQILETSMWKIIVAFIAFAALALFILNKSGGNVDMGGEKHSVEAAPAATDAAPAPAPAASKP